MRLRTLLLIIGLGLMLALLGWSTLPAAAAPQAGPVAQAENAACLVCHQDQAFATVMPNGDAYSLHVDVAAYAASIHGKSGITCVLCHAGYEPEAGHGYTFGSAREATLRLNESCARCHTRQSDQEKDGVHAAARAVGKMDAAICTDCHTAHAVRQVKDPETLTLLPDTRAWIPTTCQRCHSAIYEKYRTSVHGAALTVENNPDVPTCIDCHGVHIIEDPRTAAFRLGSPQICARCHTDADVMDKYGISTEVLNTYVSDFHGTTVSIFEQVSPDAPTDKPVCYDCHGIHDNAQVDDPQKGLMVRANLLNRCQACHPDATPNFPDAWLSHYIPSAEKYPIVYYVDLFYKFLIPGVLGPMGLLVVMDLARKTINSFRREEKEKRPSPPPPAAAPAPEPADQPQAGTPATDAEPRHE